MNQQSRIGNLVNSKIYPLLLFLVSFIFVVLFSRSTSFLYVFEGGDPSVFKQMGRAVLKGKILYIDYFDNKGCLLYFIHALGLGLGGNFALLFMQACTLTVTLSIWDKMLALYHNQRQRMICLGIALFMLFCFYGAGDQTQEWCLPFISYPLLVYYAPIRRIQKSVRCNTCSSDYVLASLPSSKLITPVHSWALSPIYGFVTCSKKIFENNSLVWVISSLGGLSLPFLAYSISISRQDGMAFMKWFMRRSYPTLNIWDTNGKPVGFL